MIRCPGWPGWLDFSQASGPWTPCIPCGQAPRPGLPLSWVAGWPFGSQLPDSLFILGLSIMNFGKGMYTIQNMRARYTHVYSFNTAGFGNECFILKFRV